MSHTVDEKAQQPRLVVERYDTMDMVSINFILPKGVLSNGRGTEVAKEVQAYIAEKGLPNGHVSHHLPAKWHKDEDGNWQVDPGSIEGPYDA